MKSKYFAVKIRKRRTGGRIRIDMEARYFEDGLTRDNFPESQQGGGAGWRAHIFDTRINKSMRVTRRWDDVQIAGTSDYYHTNTTYHDTGAEASRWIETVRMHLHKLDAHADHMTAEVAALRD